MSLSSAVTDLATRIGQEIKALRTEIPETVRDTMATALVQGSGVTLTVDDPANTITISATGGGGGGSLTLDGGAASSTYGGGGDITADGGDANG